MNDYNNNYDNNSMTLTRNIIIIIIIIIIFSSGVPQWLSFIMGNKHTNNHNYDNMTMNIIANTTNFTNKVCLHVLGSMNACVKLQRSCAI